MTSPGYLLAEFLTGAWRVSPPPLDLEVSQLEAITPLLLGSGAGALGWWRIQYTDLKHTEAGLQLQQAYREHTLRVAMHEHEIIRVFGKLHTAGVEALLIKGWGLTQYYAQKGLRPFGDVDIYIRPNQIEATTQILGVPVDMDGPLPPNREPSALDIKSCFPQYYDESIEGLFAASQCVQIGPTSVRIPSPEDHLRILCIHFLRHGAWRPLWLCDIAAALEARPQNFDWDRCLGKSHRRADWVACAIGIAHQIFGVNVEDTPVVKRSLHLPRWLVPTVLKSWNQPGVREHRVYEPMAVSLKVSLRQPSHVWEALVRRWPNPIESAILMQSELGILRPVPLQLVQYLGLTYGFLRRLI